MECEVFACGGMHGPRSQRERECLAFLHFCGHVGICMTVTWCAMPCLRIALIETCHEFAFHICGMVSGVFCIRTYIVSGGNPWVHDTLYHDDLEFDIGTTGESVDSACECACSVQRTWGVLHLNLSMRHVCDTLKWLSGGALRAAGALHPAEHVADDDQPLDPIMLQNDIVTCKFAAINITSMIHRLEDVAGINADVIIASETRCTLEYTEKFSRTLRARGIHVVWGSPVHSSERSNGHRYPDYSGVAILAKAPFLVTPIPTPPELQGWRDAGRLTLARISTPCMTGYINVVGLYGHVSDPELRSQLLGEVADFIASTGSADWVVGGDFNSTTAASPAWTNLLALEHAVEPLDMYDERPEEERVTCYVGRGSAIDHIYCSAGLAQCCSGAEISHLEAFPSHHLVSATFTLAALPPRTVRAVPASLPLIVLDKTTREREGAKEDTSTIDSVIAEAHDADSLTIAFHEWSRFWEAWYVRLAEGQNFVVKDSQKGRGCCTTKLRHGQKRAAVRGDHLPEELVTLRSLIAKLTSLAFSAKYGKEMTWDAWGNAVRL
eukprot:3683371-Amphidinium_carterae.2